MIYCRQCGKERDWPFSAIRTGRGRCQICGAPGPNYSYPDGLLPGTKEDINRAADREYEGKTEA